MAFLGAGLLSAPAITAPLVDQQPQARADDAGARAPARPAFVAPTGRSLADRDGNGLSDGLEQLLASSGPDARVDVIVTFAGAGAGNAASVQRAVGAFAVRREFRLISGFAATMTAAQARALATAAGVFRVEEDATAYVTLEAARRDFGVEALRPATETAGYSGTNVKVCVIDTGVQPDHEQFTDGAGSRVVGFDDMIGDYFGTIRENAYDDHGHGTHVAGIVGGDGVKGTTGTADPDTAPLARGVAPGVEIHAVKVLDYNGSGSDSGIIAGIEACQLAGAHVVNMSLGIPGSSDGRDALSTAVDAAVDAGMVVVVAAGNAGDGEATIGSPGAAAKAITVGAVAEHSASTVLDATSLGVYMAPFSSRGPTLDGRIKPDIAAPGVSILSAMTSVIAEDPDPFFGGGGEYDLGCGEGCYIVISGTSMASPFVAGAVALMMSADATLTSDAVRQILSETAQDRGALGKDNVYGHGLVDVEAAVRRAAAEDPNAVAFPHHVFQTGTVPDGTAVRVPVGVIDMTKPLAVTIAIDGRLTRRGWSPDLDATLLDASGAPFMIPNPLYPILGGEPFFPAPGTSSTCPAGELCGQVGTQETIRVMPGDLQPGSPLYYVEVYPFADRPNNGKGGTFAIGLANGYFAGPIDGAHDDALVAEAGSNATVTVDDGDTFADVVLDGRASRGVVSTYQWKDDSGGVLAEGAVAMVSLPVGTHTLSLSVTDGATDVTDTVTVTVQGASSDGGGGGGGKGGGKPCNPKKEACV
jgi:serine protease AprX